jgi:dUTP pyrophosphatase
MNVRLSIKRVGPIEVPLPSYQTPGSAGLDLRAALAEPIRLGCGERRLFPTGLALAIPQGFEGQVRSRSGLALRQGVSVLNAPGTIDSDYRGELGVVLINLGSVPVFVRPLDRIAQLVIAPVAMVEIELVSELHETSRGAGGYGSTGLL